jgi:hypothetical protein
MSTEYIVFVTRHYHFLVKPFISLCDKYFDIPLTFFSDRPILDIDKRHKVMQVFPYNCALYRESCCNYIRRGLEQIQTPLISIQLIDQLLQRNVNKSQIAILEKFMLKNHIARGNLCVDFQNQINNIMIQDPKTILYQEDDISIVYISPFNPHIGTVGATHLMPALWNKQFLLEFMEDKWSFDAIEMPGAKKFTQQTKDNKNKWRSVGTNPAQFTTAHLIYTRDTNLVELTQLKPEDRPLVQPYIPNSLRVKE